MPRKGAVPRREILPDPVYHDVTVARFINKIMLKGKKSTAEGIFYGALDIIAERYGQGSPCASSRPPSRT